MFGFDVGTTITKSAHGDPSGKPVIIANARNEAHTPSVVFFGPHGDVLVGTEALEQGLIDPQRCVRAFKLELGSNRNLLGDGQVVTATDATEQLIRYLKQTIEQRLGVAVNEGVATCPANSRDDFKQALIEAFERCGIKVLKLVFEPTAAGLAYACDKAGHNMKVAVYDFGGGTFDVSILHVQGAQIDVLATDGVARLGGNDLNDCLRRPVLEGFKAKFNTQLAPGTHPLLWLELEQRIERAKISLNTRNEVPIVIGYKGDQLIVNLSQAQFHADIKPLVQQSLDALDRAAKAAGLSFSQIDRLIMVGGTSNSRFIQEAVAAHTGLMPQTDIDPQNAVVYGAALASIAELASQGRTATIRGQVIPSPDIFVREVTAHDVGCGVVDLSGANKRHCNAVIIPRNTPIPCRKTDQFYLQYDDQTDARIEILQGDPDADRDKCLLIGELTLTNLPKETKRTPRIQVEYVIDANGMVTATGTDKVSGQQQTISVDYKKGIKARPKPAAA